MNIKSVFHVVIAILVCELAGILGSLFTINSIQDWYQYIEKPLLSPPNWIFGPVWTTLYFLMGISVYLIWRKGLKTRGVQNALTLFAIQLVLNAIWTPIFFGARNLGLALVEIVAMWFAILVTILTFYRLSKPAAWLMVPYLLWVSFATYLNFAIWRLN